MRLIAGLLLIAGIVFSQPKLVVENPWVREVPPVSTMSAAFFTLKNTGDEDDYLVGVESKVAEVAEIHTTVMEEGMMKMRMLKEVKVPAGSSVEFKPMGNHIMLINLRKPLKAGDTVDIVLLFKKSGKVKVSAPVRSMNMHMHHR